MILVTFYISTIELCIDTLSYNISNNQSNYNQEQDCPTSIFPYIDITKSLSVIVIIIQWYTSWIILNMVWIMKYMSTEGTLQLLFWHCIQDWFNWLLNYHFHNVPNQRNQFSWSQRTVNFLDLDDFCNVRIYAVSL